MTAGPAAGAPGAADDAPDGDGAPTAGGAGARVRLRGIDLARSLALVGMVLVHVWPSGDAGGPVALTDRVAGGRASALFAVLAGCGLALATGGEHPWTGGRLARARRAVLARAGVVAAVGLTVGGVPTPAAVILAYYGLLFVVAVPALGWRPRRLLAAAAVAAVVAPVASHLLRRASPRGPGANLGWADLVDAPGDLARTLLLDGYYPVLTWSAYLLLGLAVGRLPLAATGTAVRLAVVGGLGAAAGAGIAAVTVALAGGAAALGRSTGETAAEVLHRLGTSSYGTSPTASWWWLGTAGRHSGTGPDLLHTGGSAVAVLGVALLVVAGAERAAARGRLLPRRLLAPLLAVGATTLSLYAVHVLALGAVADTDALEGLAPGPAVVGHLALLLAVAAVIGAPRRRGPLEALAAAAGRAAARTGPGRATTTPDVDLAADRTGDRTDDRTVPRDGATTVVDVASATPDEAGRPDRPTPVESTSPADDRRPPVP